eukprot:CAMPEP_0201506396 /NCGR_PEP_ID=MMETSP0161_2-20130828/306_1 /ASSEMBLY_ACC=CAM_ASM_000251 /TAXON_ID=180227 /ORGANISM="Neoparamoeba aestuarina, Strain SoJaBio B1-5/56/2" /LENGTH=842 /DNA_ID=CAMNT_0047900467 /DNA_START=131 /DNA_END=2656 /DNA_ORIENTATION=-
MTKFLLSLALVLVLVGSLHGEETQWMHKPYLQIVSRRMTYSGKTAIGDWKVLEGIEYASLVIPLTRVDGAAIVLTPSGMAYLSPDDDVQTVENTPESVRGESAVIAAPTCESSDCSSFDFVVATPTAFGRCNLNISNTPVTWDCPEWTNTPAWNKLPVTEVAMLGETGDAWVGTIEGLFYIPGGATDGELVKDLPAEPITGLAVRWRELELTTVHLAQSDPNDPRYDVAVGMKNRMFRLLTTGRWNFYRNSTNIDGTTTALSFVGPDGVLFVGNDNDINVQLPDMSFWRFDEYAIPYPKDVTSFAAFTTFGEEQKRAVSEGKGVWVGTKWGLMRFNQEDGENQDTNHGWRYFNGARYLPTSPSSSPVQSHVISVCPLAGEVEEVLVATTYGLARLRMEKWTLEQKAAHLQTLVYPQHDRYGLTAGCSLNSFGDRSSYAPTPSDNDGLWTNMYLSSQAYRFASTGSEDAEANAKKSMNAILFLQQVTGLPGYPARSYGQYGDSGTSYNPNSGQHTWFNSTTYPGWVYKSDTSSDEICGHEVGISLYHDLVVGNDGGKKRESGDVDEEGAKEAVLNITSWIVQNGYQLVSNFDEVTTWGRWDPLTLNDDPDWYSEMGLNSLQILSWLKLAERLSQDKQYSLLFDQLWLQNGYDRNILNQKVTTPDDNNPSDDELSWLSYMAWLRAEKVGKETADFPPEFWQSINRSIAINKPQKPSLWNIIYLTTVATNSTTTPTTFTSKTPATPFSSSTFHDKIYSSPNLEELWEDALWCLKSWPIETIEWPIYNSHRHDIVWSHYLDRGGRPNAVTLLRYDEVPFYKWNANVFEVDGGSGMSEATPTAFLFP